jgi:hypothetical protein
MSPIMAFDKKYQMRRLDGRTLDDLPWGNENAVAQLVEPKIGGNMLQGKWKYNKGFKNRPAHYFPPQSKFTEWDKSQCGYFAYPDMLEEAKVIIPALCCRKCLKSATVPKG